jgi:hypothetical protein
MSNGASARHRAVFITVIAAVAACRDGSPDAADTDTTTTTGDAGPQPGAPDEHCSLDPAKVYVHEEWGGRSGTFLRTSTLTDLADNSNVCAVYDTYAGRLDPVDGSLVSIRGGPTGRIRLVKTPNDWMVPTGAAEVPWAAGHSPDNDIDLGEIMWEADIVCTGHEFRELFSDDTTVYASCGGVVLNGPDIPPSYSEYVVGFVEGRRIIDSLYYSVETEDGSVPIPIPGEIDYLQHVAVRPDGDALLAAVIVGRGEVYTFERALVKPSGVTLVGAYSHDIAEAGVVGFSSHAIAADGTLYSLGGSGTEYDNLVGPPDGDTTIVRLPVDGPPEIIYTAAGDVGDPDTFVRLVGVGSG